MYPLYKNGFSNDRGDPEQLETGGYQASLKEIVNLWSPVLQVNLGQVLIISTAVPELLHIFSRWLHSRMRWRESILSVYREPEKDLNSEKRKRRAFVNWFKNSPSGRELVTEKSTGWESPWRQFKTAGAVKAGPSTEPVENWKRSWSAQRRTGFGKTSGYILQYVAWDWKNFKKKVWNIVHWKI